MSIWKNGKLVAGGRQATPLLSFVWADHILDDISWLSADTFSWQSGSVYQAVYQHLANDIDGKSLQSETVSGTTIQFYLADDGHKICPESEMSNVAAIYAATGVAWYYIIDTANERFKLPRTKFGFTGLRDNVGKYVEPGLPNITGGFRNDGNKNNNSGLIWGTSGAFRATSQASIAVYTPSSTATVSTAKISFDASESNAIYGNSTTVQTPAIQMYLYFYVEQFTQTALENTAGVVAEDFNELNAHKVIAFQAPTAENNYTWYRKYADGWVEQGGMVTETSTVAQKSIVFPVEMADTNYNLQVTLITDTNSNNPTYYAVGARTKSATGFTCYAAANFTKDWKVCGMAA
jgi:hypothetical protein